MIIDSDSSITDLLRLNLASEGYTVSVSETTANLGLPSLRHYHLLIIDGSDMSPSGLNLIENIRSANGGDRTGIIYYSSYNNERTLIDALDAGADDCICKPFSLREMMARIRAVLRRRTRYAPAAVSDDENPEIVSVDTLSVNLEKKTVAIDDEPVQLSATEFSILELLLRHPGQHVPRIEIFKKIWPGGTGANERIVDTNISRLRRKLGNYSACITSRQGMGYTFTKEK